MNENLSTLISNKTIFPINSDQLYYFVRESYVSDERLYSWRAEGFCKSARITSEMITGQVLVDGHFKHDFGIGDTVTMSCLPKHFLKCVQLH